MSDMTVYADFGERLIQILRALNEIEKLPTEDPRMPYLGGPIPLLLDGEPCGQFVNEIGDEWCYRA